jgi:hypothetical protein
MATGGTYRIESTTLNKEFPAPPETAWDEQPIAAGLNGIPINSGYKVHTWQFENMLGSDFDDLASLESDQSCDEYGTKKYTDFFIQNIAPRTRGLPLYQSVTITFEVFA